MVEKKPIRTIRIGNKLWDDLRVLADESEETISEYVRRQLHYIVDEEKSQK